MIGRLTKTSRNAYSSWSRDGRKSIGRTPISICESLIIPHSKGGLEVDEEGCRMVETYEALRSQSESLIHLIGV